MNSMDRNRIVRDLRVAELYVEEIRGALVNYEICRMWAVRDEQTRELAYWEGEVRSLREKLAVA
ncbi:hypothetical protein ABZZ79_01270 [Streptomyces sp. NPDC006458]|uniref:hypothetical protein n=1 Tax=Streptomyces sp. NPDC006458 TaxID=3154302 RepID=UPI00339F7C97